MDKAVYQSQDFKNAELEAGRKIIDITSDFYAIERTITFPGIGKKKILEARGDPTEKQASEFKKVASNYFYGTIALTVVSKKDVLSQSKSFFKTSNATVLIDTTQTLAELWKLLEKKSARWGATYAEKNGVTFEQSNNNQDISVFYDLYSETAKEGNFTPEPLAVIRHLANSKAAKLFLIKQSSEIVAGGLVLLDQKYRYTILDCTTVSKKGLSLQAMPFLYWKIIEFSKNNGFSYFDLGGYDSSKKLSEKMAQINRFKDRFGGKVTEQPIYSTNRKYLLLRKIANYSNSLRRMYKKD